MQAQTTTLTNRFTPTSLDGWVMLAPYGEFPHAMGDEAIVQAFDSRAAKAMVAAYNADRLAGERDIYFDLDHLGDDPGNPTEAAAWVVGLEARHDGLYGKLRMTDVGEQALSTGRYRYLSPTWLVSRTNTFNDQGVPMVRPVKLLGGGFTNQPNLPLQPLSNQKHQSPMDLLKELRAALALPADAANDAILAAVRNRQAAPADGQVTAERDELRNRLNTVTAERDELRNREIETVLDQHSAAMAGDADRAFWRDALLRNREQTVTQLEALAKRLAKPDGGEALTNRHPGQNPDRSATAPTDAATAAETQRAAKIRNRAAAIQSEQKCSWSRAWALADEEIV